MQGILASSNKAYYVCTRAENLLEQGFTFRKDDDGSMEVAEHYSVDFGPDAPTVEDVNRFIKSFDPDPVRRPK
ncbi:hypothetical protein EDE04_3259 [Streptomyces sp. 2132.2]|nr:hypothetical protein EDE04_3259 [Streptomyces sp. 2132.2]